MTNRVIVYPLEVPYEADILNTNKDSYVGVGRFTGAIIGTTEIVNGLNVTPTVVPSLNVLVTSGEIYSYKATDPSSYGVLPSDSNLLMKQGLYFGGGPFATPAPVTAGFSVNYLIQASFQEIDENLENRPYFNPADPTNPVFTTAVGSRNDNCVVSIKTGVPAPTGTQVTPTPDAGYMGIRYITVTNGQTTVTTSDIHVYSGRNAITETLTQKISKATGDTLYIGKVDINYNEGVVNGGAMIAQREEKIISSGLQVGLTDAIYAGATSGITGFLSHTTTAPIGVTGNAFWARDITNTIGVGDVTVAFLMPAEYAQNYTDLISSFQCKVYHDTGLTLSGVTSVYTANAKDNFSALTLVSLSGSTSIPTATGTLLTFEGFQPLSSARNGILIQIFLNFSANFASKNFYFTEAQMNVGSTISSYIPRDSATERMRCRRQYQKSYSDGVPAGTGNQEGWYGTMSSGPFVENVYLTVPYNPPMTKVPNVTVYHASLGTAGFFDRVSDNAAIAAGFVTGQANNNSFSVYNTVLTQDAVAHEFSWKSEVDFFS